MKKLILIVVLFTGAGCTWVKPSEGGQSVALLSEDAVLGCERIGRTTAMSKHKVAGIKRSSKKLQNELTTMAKNRAAVMGGNAVSALGPVNGDEQTFAVYQCDP